MTCHTDAAVDNGPHPTPTTAIAACPATQHPGPLASWLRSASCLRSEKRSLALPDTYHKERLDAQLVSDLGHVL